MELGFFFQLKPDICATTSRSQTYFVSVAMTVINLAEMVVAEGIHLVWISSLVQEIIASFRNK